MDWEVRVAPEGMMVAAAGTVVGSVESVEALEGLEGVSVVKDLLGGWEGGLEAAMAEAAWEG